MGADDRVAAHHAVLDAGEVHRPAFAAHQSVGTSEQFGHDRCQWHATRNRVGVASIGREGPVVGAHRRAEPGRDGFLAE